MNLIEAKYNINLKVIKIEGARKSQKDFWNFLIEKSHRRRKYNKIDRRFLMDRIFRRRMFGKMRHWNKNHDHYGFRRGWNLRKKLENLGIREGVIIKKVQQQAFRGPVIIEVGNSRVAIGCLIATAIKVEEIEK